ncbi:hypothetical protein F5Y19DRAFT_411947, partial [Xylariaceae sp. FL1651]
MTTSGFQKWWRSQFVMTGDASSAICPCASCFNGTGHNTARAKRDPKHYFTMKNYPALESRESMASDLAPLCSADKWTPRSSFETL